jgi:hypothetical protein
MAEYVLDPGHWPELPPMHRAYLDRALPMFQADARLAGLAAGGSFITGELDEHSDLDLVVVSLPGAAHDVLREGSEIAQRLGPLPAAFPGDSALSTAKAEYPQPRLGFVRARVLGPLVLFQAGARPNGVRRVEQSVPARVPALRSTLALHDRESCRNALVATVALYTDLREQLASPTLVRRTDAERAARSFLS